MCTWTGEPPDPVQVGIYPPLITTPATIKQGGNASHSLAETSSCDVLQLAHVADSSIRGLSQPLMTDRQISGVDSESKTF